ncbi:MAG: chitobiase/beta-hexosaminidase C-terminal domain-containing protein [Halanaerobium sp.]|nr:chitobiase/beta-hexosaminidase C-terminal domain-containing protein [Halanaerobium sp.]
MKKTVLLLILSLVMLSMITGCDNVVKYTLEITVEGEGEVIPPAGVHKIPRDTTISLTAIPAEGFTFSHWGGPDGDQVTEENKLVVSRNLKITAVFTAQSQQTVETPQFSVPEGTYEGAQSISISCATSGAEIRYTTDGSEPTPTNGTIFTDQINVYKDMTLKAIAYKEGMINSSVAAAAYTINYTLTVVANPANGGSIVVDPDQATYKYNTPVNLLAVPGTGYNFSGWSGDASGTENSLDIYMDANKSVTAEFTAWDVVSAPQFSVSAGTYVGARDVTISCATSGADIWYTTNGDDPSPLNGTLYEDSAINVYRDTTLKAIAIKEGMTDSTITTATYIINYTLSVTASPSAGGSVSVDPDQTTYKYNGSVKLTATANSGYNFGGWSGDASGTTNPLTVVMDKNKSITAIFQGIPYDVTFTVEDEGGNPLEGATISIAGESMDTDASGQATFSLLAGSYSYSVTYSDYEVANGNVTVLDGAISENVTLYYYADDVAELAAALADSTKNYINLSSSVYNISTSSITITGNKTLKSASPSTVWFNIYQDMSLISLQTAVNGKMLYTGDLTLAADKTLALETKIDGNLIMGNVTLDLNGQNLTVTGSIYQPAGIIDVNGGTLDIAGDYLIDSIDPVDPGYSSGHLYMLDADDRVNVGGNFVMDGTDHRDDLTAGILTICGNFTQESNNTSLYSYRNFFTSETHRVVLAGSAPQEVSFTDPGAGASHFAELELANETGPITFATLVPVRVKLINNQTPGPVNSKNLYLSANATVEGGIWPWDMSLNEDWNLQQDLTIQGDYYVTSHTLSIGSGNALHVGGTVYQPAGIIDVNGGTLDIAGDYLIDSIDPVDPGYSNGYLTMDDVGDRVNIGGSLVMDSRDHTNKLSVGILTIGGNLTQESNNPASYSRQCFQATGTHRVVLAGSGPQEVSFADPHSTSSCFAELELANETGTITFATPIPVAVKLINNQTPEPTNSNHLNLAGSAMIEGGSWLWDLGLYEYWTLQQNTTIGGDLYLYAGTLDKNTYLLDVVGNIYELGGVIVE